MYKWAQKKEIEKPISILVGCFGAAFLFLSLAFIQQTEDVATGVFMGVLYYGYPGGFMALLAFRLLRPLKKVSN